MNYSFYFLTLDSSREKSFTSNSEVNNDILFSDIELEGKQVFA